MPLHCRATSGVWAPRTASDAAAAAVEGGNMRGHLAVSAALVVALVAPALAHAAPPANDAFASAETISGASGTVYGTTVDATSEPGEPQSLALNHSIWYAWTAPDYGTLNFDTAGTKLSVP